MNPIVTYSPARPQTRSEQVAAAEIEVEEVAAELSDAEEAETDCYWTQKASRDHDDWDAWQTARSEVTDLRAALRSAEGRLEALR